MLENISDKMEVMKDFDFIYPAAISVIFLTIYLIAYLKLRTTKSITLKRFRKKDIYDPVETDSPVDNQDAVFKERGIDSIEYRYSFLIKALPIVLLTLWLIFIVLPYIGRIPAVYISILAAVISVIAGFSLRPFLENLFAGVVIFFFKSIKVGDTVIIDGHYGLVEQIELTYSIVKRWDWNRIVIPNTKMIQKEIENLTMNDKYLWAHVEFYVEPDADLDKVMEIATSVAKKSSYDGASEDPSFWVMDLQKDAIKCWVAAWADNPGDAWELRHKIRMGLLSELKKNGISTHKNIWSTNV